MSEQKAKCCPKGEDYLQWRGYDFVDGPNEEGWCLNVNGVGDPSWEKIQFCPWCGKNLHATTDDCAAIDLIWVLDEYGELLRGCECAFDLLVDNGRLLKEDPFPG